MSGPARAGIFIYASDVERIATFYESTAAMDRLHASDGHIILQSADVQMLVHRMPDEYAAQVHINTPPRRRDAAVKFFLTVASLDQTRATARALGGDVFDENYPGPGFVICNAVDPEGNVFQLRELLR